MKGDFVILRTFDTPLVRRVVEMVDDVIFIASDNEFSRLVNGLDAADPIGFPSQDVFQYDPKLEKDLARGKVEWKRLTPYKGEGQSRKA
jgi:hypothetical protein